MDIIGFTEEMMKIQVKNYSGGMKRRLNIGVALLHYPELVIMDEPTVGIDLKSRGQILEAVRELASEGTGVLYVGHSMEEIEKICNRICILVQGKSVFNEILEKALKRDEKKVSLEQLYIEYTENKT